MSHEETLKTKADAYRRAQSDLDRARAELTEAILMASSDLRQVDILRATSHVWTREQLRKLERSHNG